MFENNISFLHNKYKINKNHVNFWLKKIEFHFKCSTDDRKHKIVNFQKKFCSVDI